MVILNVKLIANTALSPGFLAEVLEEFPLCEHQDRAAVALTAIRTCYSPLKPTEILPAEGAKYFGNAATDGEGGTESDRLFRHIVRSKHTSTLEHITYTFAIEGVSRSLLAQLTRHRQFSFSVQSQRYVRFGSGDKSGGFDHVMPPTVANGEKEVAYEVIGWTPNVLGNPAAIYDDAMKAAQAFYDSLRAAGVPAEDARMVLPNAAACNIVMTANLRALIEFYGKRRPGNGAQWEIADLADRLRDEIVKVDAWTAEFFTQV